MNWGLKVAGVALLVRPPVDMRAAAATAAVIPAPRQS